MIDMVLWNILIQRFRVCKASKVLVLRDAGGINGTKNGNGRPQPPLLRIWTDKGYDDGKVRL